MILPVSMTDWICITTSFNILLIIKMFSLCSEFFTSLFSHSLARSDRILFTASINTGFSKICFASRLLFCSLSATYKSCSFKFICIVCFCRCCECFFCFKHFLTSTFLSIRIWWRVRNYIGCTIVRLKWLRCNI